MKKVNVVTTTLPLMDEEGQQIPIPVAVLEERILKRNNGIVG